MRRGEVYWADLEPRSGSEQRGHRPVVIVSRDALNRVEGWASVIIVPLSTSARQAGRSLTSVPVPRGTAGVGHSSVALCHQVSTIDRRKLGRRIGTLPDELVTAVDAGLRCALALE
jgi:mRNA interferase MazF